MNCRCAQNLLSAYVDGELAGVEMLRLREHLGVCPACRAAAWGKASLELLCITCEQQLLPTP